MSQVNMIVTPDKLFDILIRVSEKYQLDIIFRRFDNKNQNAGWKVITNSDTILKKYLDNGYQQIYLSEGILPKNEQDWNFTEDAGEYLIIISGGRTRGSEIELTNIRVFHKKSKLKKVYRFIRQIIKNELTQKEIYLNSHPYNNIFFTDDIWKYDVYQNLDHKNIRITKSMQGPR